MQIIVERHCRPTCGNPTGASITLGGTPVYNKTSTYDKYFRLSTVAQGGKSTAYAYDANGNVTSGTSGAKEDKNRKARKMEQSKERLAILEKIAQYEKEGRFDRDVENDPPSRPLRPGECDYTEKKLFSKVSTGVANTLGRSFFNGCIRRGELVIAGVEGLENFLAVKDRALIVTANHFSIYDNYIVYKAMEPHLPHRRLYKVIREGNFTAFPGLFGYLFRHCNTLPIPSATKVWREFTDAVSTLLKQGEKILIYPEQGMWWNYRKPRPMKAGAFYFAVKENVPVLPIFITMEDTEKIGADGFPILAHTLHFLPALYPKDGYTQRDAASLMAQENYDAWKAVYEKVYGVPLTYTTEHEVKPVY